MEFPANQELHRLPPPLQAFEVPMFYVIADTESFDFSNLQSATKQTLELARSIDISDCF